MRLFARHTSAPPAWRISFSLSEKLLVDDFSMPQRKCFLLLKTLLKTVAMNVNEELEEKHGEDNFTRFKVSSFLLKHTMFWTMEEVDMLEWRMNNLHKCILHVISKLESFLADRCVPHYFFGKRKNLLHGDMVENTESERNLLESKCKMMLDGIMKMKENNFFFEMIISATNPNIQLLDFQWSNETSLFNESLVMSFSDLIRSVKNGDKNLKSKLINHHQVMMKLIESAPRKYGTGVNKEFLEFLSNEVDILYKEKDPLQTLDAMEVEKLRTKLKDFKETINLNPINILQYEMASLVLQPNSRRLGQTIKLSDWKKKE